MISITYIIIISIIIECFNRKIFQGQFRGERDSTLKENPDVWRLRCVQLSDRRDRIILEHPVYQDTAKRKARVRRSILSLVGGAASRWSARSRGLIRDGIRRRGQRRVGSSRVAPPPPPVLVAASRPAVTDSIVAIVLYTHRVRVYMYRYRLTPVRVRTFVPECRFSLRLRRAIFSPSSRASSHSSLRAFPPSFRGSFNRLREPRSRFPARFRSLTLLPWETPARRFDGDSASARALREKGEEGPRAWAPRTRRVAMRRDRDRDLWGEREVKERDSHGL